MDDAGKESLRASKVCKVGMASCVLGMVSGIGTCANFLIAAVVGLTDRTPNIIFVGLTGIAWLVFAGLSLIGIIVGIYSCLEKSNSIIPAAIGIGVNTLVLLFVLAIFILGF